MQKEVIDYGMLQRNLDRVIGLIGLPRVNSMICSFIDNSSIQTSEIEKLKLITAYVISQSIIIFDLDESQFYESKVDEYREARMACYHLLAKYTKSTHGKIGERFGRKKHNVRYAYEKCEEMLSIPEYYKSFIEKYECLENQLIVFLAKF